MEKRLIFKTLEANDWNKARAADILGITTRTLRNKLNEYREQPQ
jgi:DNA-binding NtrC family response regulator